MKRLTASMLIALSCVGCIDRIEAANVGIEVQLTGNERGVAAMQIKSGWVTYNPFSEQIVEFPVSVTNTLWKDGEAITFSSSEGVNVTADVGMSWHVEATLAPKMYAKFRQSNLDNLANGYLHNTVRQSFNDVGSKMTIQDIYGAGKDKLIAEATEHCRALLSPDGFVIDQMGINGALKLPENVVGAINRTIEATQQAIQSENSVRQVKAMTEQTIAKAHGEAEAARQAAQGDADAKLIRAVGDAKAWDIEGKAKASWNERVRGSLSPELVRYYAIERWNGTVPHVNGGNQSILVGGVQ